MPVHVIRDLTNCAAATCLKHGGAAGAAASPGFTGPLCPQVAKRVVAAKGPAAAHALAQKLDREWLQLKSIRQRFTCVPAQVPFGFILVQEAQAGLCMPLCLRAGCMRALQMLHTL